jgi:hypothetical protein
VLKTVDLRNTGAPGAARDVQLPWLGQGGRPRRRSFSFDLTYLFPRELRMLVERNGLRVEHLWGDYDGQSDKRQFAAHHRPMLPDVTASSILSTYEPGRQHDRGTDDELPPAAGAPQGAPQGAAAAGPGVQRQMVNFAFYKLDPAFRRLGDAREDPGPQRVPRGRRTPAARG